jgi:hypothetical protein
MMTPIVSGLPDDGGGGGGSPCLIEKVKRHYSGFQ